MWVAHHNELAKCKFHKSQNEKQFSNRKNFKVDSDLSRSQVIKITHVLRIFLSDCLRITSWQRCVKWFPSKLLRYLCHVHCAMCHIAKHQLSVRDIVSSAIMSAEIKASIANNCKTLIGLEYIAVLIDPTDTHFCRFCCLLCRVNEKAVLALAIMDHIESDTHQLQYLVSRTSCGSILRPKCI